MRDKTKIIRLIEDEIDEVFTRLEDGDLIPEEKAQMLEKLTADLAKEHAYELDEGGSSLCPWKYRGVREIGAVDIDDGIGFSAGHLGWDGIASELVLSHDRCGNVLLVIRPRRQDECRTTAYAEMAISVEDAEVLSALMPLLIKRASKAARANEKFRAETEAQKKEKSIEKDG